PQGLDLDAEREKIRREIEQLERSLQPGGAEIQLALSDSSLSSGTGSGGSGRSPAAAAALLSFLPKCLICLKEVEVEGEEDSSDDDDDDIESLPQNPETCLQMNHVYQDVIKEKIEEVELLVAQNRQQQKEIICELDGPKPAKAGDGRNLPINVFLGHFMKPYFKDKITGIGPPSNEEAKEKAAQGIKSFEQLNSAKWKTAEKILLQQSVVSDRLQRLLQPKLLKLSYWNQKLEKIMTDTEKQILEKQIKELEQEIEAINQLPESDLIGNRFDEHDWDKISNIHFDGQRSSEELKKFWQNCEHPSINKNEWTEEELEKLKSIAAEHHCLDWQAIAQELGTNRTPFQCLQKYQIFNKYLKRKEWTKDEDQMLLELVQEMRVGSHIPYKKIAYYMEGRDSAQLIYRWTKSVDPGLKKGPWTPKEDALLMAAVKKYRGKNWYKIRTEVPGRSDAQCRDRYLKVLHWDVKKGKWSLEEEEQLIELVQKHGLGHWSKIASELPHRTGAQCLSKWKIMIGSQKKRSGASRQHHAEESSSPSESSSEDMELELADSSEDEKVTSSKRKEEFAVPSIDLWIPTGIDTQGATRERYQSKSLLSAARAGTGSSCSDVPRAGCDGDRAADKSPELNTLLRGISLAYSTDMLVKNAAEVMAKAAQRGKHVLRVSLEDVRRILKSNTRFQRKLVSASCVLFAPVILSAQPPGVAAAVVQDVQGLQELHRRARHWRRLSLERKLLMAVTPWVGDVLLPRTLQAGRMAFHQTKAAAIHEKLKSVSLTSTPLFALLIRLLQIDTKGCMNIIKEKKQLELLKANARSLQQKYNLIYFFLQASQNTETSSGSAVRRAPALRARDSPTGALESCAPAVQGAPPAQGQWHKTKTVSELLQEKRLRESQAKAAMQRTVLVAPQVLVSGPLIIQHPAQQIIPSAQAGSKPAAAAGTDSQVQGSPVPTRTSASALVPENRSSTVPETGESPVSSQRTELQSMVALGLESGTNKLSLSTPVTCELKSNQPQQRPVSLLPAFVTPQVASPVIPNSILPFRWVVTPQGLLPSTVQTVVGVPQGMPAAAGGSQGQTAVTSNDSVSALRGTPVAAEANPPHPRSAAPHNNAPGKHGCSGAQALRNRPIACKPPSADVPPQPSTSSAEKNLLDFSLISLEDQGLVREWLSGIQGVQVPSLQTRLPYLPPFLCSIKTLSKLLLQKTALEEQAASLLPSEASGDGGTGDVFRAVGELVQQKLGDNPAYLLLKARFLAAFTLPAVLATLPPPKVTTTLSGVGKQHEESDDEEWLSEKKVFE
ncbi:SNPC4 protein, partial [Irena cyanogastra]|nr:SNPC4 protein [Irena cyanogastra]